MVTVGLLCVRPGAHCVDSVQRLVSECSVDLTLAGQCRNIIAGF